MARITIENVAYYHSKHYTSLQILKQPGEMHGARRVIVFCLLTAVLPTILLIVPLYLRHSVYANVTYAVAESDVLEVVDGISTIFCQEQELTMNTSFHAFQLKSMPKLSHVKKHIHLKKSMVLPDDTLEYWGFYLLRGSQITIRSCARHEGARVLVVKGEKNLRTCGLMQHSKYPPKPSHTTGGGQRHVQVPVKPQPATVKPVPAAELEPAVIAPHPQNEEMPQLTHRPLRQSLENEDKKNDTKDEEFEGENDDDKTDASNDSSAEESLESGMKSLEEKFLTYIKKHTALINNTSNNETTFEDSLENDLKTIEQKVVSYINKHTAISNGTLKNETIPKERNKESTEHSSRPRRLRHAKRRLMDIGRGDGNSDDTSWNAERVLRRNRLQDSLNGNTHMTDGLKVKHRHRESELKERISDTVVDDVHARLKRDVPLLTGHMLDGGIGHGGNAANFTDILEPESSESSFELDLLSCYEGRDLFTHIISPSPHCSSTNVVNEDRTYNVTDDGYYYYIFYSDNDLYQNSLHALFDIYKTTYEYTNYTRGCINQTECKFPITFWSDEIVIAEVPTRDGIEHEDDDMSYLISSCYPRMSVYIIFPVSVLFLVLGCAFL